MFKTIALQLIFSLYIVDKSDASDVVLKRSYEGPNTDGRHLLIRRFPAVEEFQSDIYEVFAKPYGYHLQTITAITVLKGDGESSIAGEIQFEQTPGGPVHIRGNITGLPVGKHGLHIHQSGDLRNGCAGLGGHFNPYMLQHGGPVDSIRHVGDLGNIKVEEGGSAEINMVDGLIQLTGFPRGVVGRAVVVSSDPDDYGRGGDAQSLLDGNSGKPLACGVIAYIR
ncbi:hypothetical protein WA026_008615 [Henosepilachna vigintioctopunctata]|uniref:superoxide dismutase n=1 Tax=Henosepilachna vigintioctopunctata TaxID=420089 RepID=A0AAW1UJ52_9CUCU